MYLKYIKSLDEVKAEDDPKLPAVRGTADGKMAFKSERICQSIMTNRSETFVPSKLTKRRKKKTVFYEVDPEFNHTYTQNLVACSHHPQQQQKQGLW